MKHLKTKLTLLLAGSAIALSAQGATAAVTPDQAALLKTTLTPLGAERAGSADGLIPPWTGGETTPPAGWTPSQNMPDLYASDQPVVTINAANMAQYEDRLTPGVMAMMQKYGFSIVVYPTHRSGAAPQWVYDNTYQNALNAKPDPSGARFGFSGAYGGIPFPVPDADPLQAGAEIMWNHQCRWQASHEIVDYAAYVVVGGVLTLSSGFKYQEIRPYYDPAGSLSTYNGDLIHGFFKFGAPPSTDGEELLEWEPSDQGQRAIQVWQYLPGQGRVRKAPELLYDTPMSQEDDVTNFDEAFVFYGSEDRYDWKLIGKKEMYVPYNDNALIATSPQNAFLPHFLDPNKLRWELHRVWIVDATLHEGERNVAPHRRFYIDEDTWNAVLADEWDAQGNIWRMSMVFNYVVPTLPGTIYGTLALYDLQTGQYVLNNSPYADPKYGTPPNFQPNAASQFNPNALAAQSQF
jgi:hypothetical protein